MARKKSRRQIKEELFKNISTLKNEENKKLKEIEKTKEKIKKIEVDLQTIRQNKIKKENELLVLELTEKELSINDIFNIINNEEIINMYKRKNSSNKENIGENNG